jgi:hypothetical protein
MKTTSFSCSITDVCRPREVVPRARGQLGRQRDVDRDRPRAHRGIDADDGPAMVSLRVSM